MELISGCCDRARHHLSRRLILNGLAAALGIYYVPARAHAAAHDKVGPVKPPIEVPNLAVLSSDGIRCSLRDLLLGKVTAIQLMFTKCKSICPIEAGTLARVEEAVVDDASRDIHLLSLSIDPATDTPEVLRAWLEQCGAGTRWKAISPAEADLARVKAFFDQPSSIGEIHSTAIHLVDRNGFLVWRTFDLPDPSDVAKLLFSLRDRPTTPARGPAT